MLGSQHDADDIVQDAWFRFDRHVGHIDNPAAWLTTVVSRMSIDRLRSASVRRETYVGPWLAEPTLNQSGSGQLGSEPADDAPLLEDSVILAESLTLGFLAVLERLSPLERAVFILHDVFALPFGEVAAIVERSEVAVRQLGRRARQHLEDGRPRFEAETQDIAMLTQLALAAAVNGDLETLQTYLAEDVMHLSDGGAHHRAARAPVLGRDRVARFFIGLAKRFGPEMAFHDVRANGQAAMYVTVDGAPYMLHVANWVGGEMTGSFAVLNPDKLRSFHEEWLRSGGPSSTS